MTARLCLLLFLFFSAIVCAQHRARDYGIKIGVLSPGKLNAITDVAGVKVGHATVFSGTSVRTGVTSILPHDGNIFKDKVPAAIYVGNGFGKLAGSTQVKELGNLETPILLTNTLSVATAIEALVEYTLTLPGNDNVQSVNAVVGETNDGYLNDIRGRHVKQEHALAAIRNAQTGTVQEGNVGAGTGTVAFGFKGGIGTSSRKLPENLGGYSVGVLVQSNFGGVLQIDGAPVGEALKKYYLSGQLKNDVDGSCMIIVATDAPLDSRNLERLAQRAIMGLAKTGGIGSNGSGDYVIAFSTDPRIRVKHEKKELIDETTYLRNDAMSPLFMAAIEATEEAIINSLLMAKTMIGKDGHTVEALPSDEVIKILEKHKVIVK